MTEESRILFKNTFPFYISVSPNNSQYPLVIPPFEKKWCKQSELPNGTIVHCYNSNTKEEILQPFEIQLSGYNCYKIQLGNKKTTLIISN